MQLLAYFIYKCPSFVADLDFKVPMLTHQLVQKSSDSRSWFVLSRFRFQPFWKLVNQENDIRIPIDLWKVTDIHSNLFHHTGWYWYRLQVDFNFNFRSSCFWHSSQLLTYSLISAAILCQKKICANLSYAVFLPLCEAIALECSKFQYLGARLG